MDETEFSPKREFLTRHKKAAEELQANRLAPWLTTTFTFTIAEMAFNGATAEKIAGAREFIREFQGLFEKRELPERFPEKKLGEYPPELQETNPKPKPQPRRKKR